MIFFLHLSFPPSVFPTNQPKALNSSLQHHPSNFWQCTKLNAHINLSKACGLLCSALYGLQKQVRAKNGGRHHLISAQCSATTMWRTLQDCHFCKLEVSCRRLPAEAGVVASRASHVILESASLKAFFCLVLSFRRFLAPHHWREAHSQQLKRLFTRHHWAV